MIRKNIIRIMGVLLGVSILSTTGCADRAKNEKLTEITYWSSSGHDKVFMNEEIAEWNNTIGRENGIKIIYKVFQSDLKKQVEIAYAQGNPPDLVGLGAVDNFEEKLIPLEEIPSAADLLERFEPYIMEGRQRINGKTYYLPIGVTTYGILYNKEMFRNAGLVDENGEPTPPKTLSELREYAKILTNPKKGEYGMIYPGKFESWYSDDIMKMTSASCGFVDGYNPKTAEFDLSSQIKVMETYMGIKADGSFYPGSDSLENDAARIRFGTGKIGMKTGGSYDFGVLTEQFPSSIEWGVAPYPIIDGEKPCYQYMGSGGLASINRESYERVGEEKMMLVYHWLYSEEQAIKAYKRGIQIPRETNLMEGIELDDSLGAFKDFASLVPRSHECPPALGIVYTGRKSISELWRDCIWTGEIEPDKISFFINELERFMNTTGRREFLEKNPKKNESASIIPDFKIYLDE